MRNVNKKDIEDIEATDEEMRSVCYTAISFLGLVTAVVGSIIFVLA